ncbi:MAG: TauD/TfdA dioxygenase family protein, partial [Rhodospirillales bacterium]
QLVRLELRFEERGVFLHQVGPLLVQAVQAVRVVPQVVEQQGRRALFLGRRPHAYVLALDVAESEALLDALWAHVDDPAFVWRHRWRVGDLLMWQNLRVLHRRDAFDDNARRIMHRSQIKGDQPIV